MQFHTLFASKNASPSVIWVTVKRLSGADVQEAGKKVVKTVPF